MKTYKRYSAGFKEQALVKVYSRSNDQTIEMVANELNINVTTLKDWISRDGGLQPRLKRLILQLSLKDHRRNMPAFGYIAPFGCFNSFRNVKDGVANPVLLRSNP